MGHLQIQGLVNYSSKAVWVYKLCGIIRYANSRPILVGLGFQQELTAGLEALPTTPWDDATVPPTDKELHKLFFDSFWCIKYSGILSKEIKLLSNIDSLGREYLAFT